MIFKSNIGNSNWFAFTIICLYIISYLSFRFIKRKKNFIIGFFIINILCILHIYFVFNYFYPKKTYSVDNILCFIIGILFSLLKYYLNRIFMRNDIFYFGNTSIIIVLYYYYYHKKGKNIILISITNSLFCLIIVILTMKIRLKNEFLLFLNTHSYSIYLLQRQVMIFIFHKRYFLNNEFIRFFFMFIIILFESNLFDKYTNCINKIFYYKSKESQNNTLNVMNKNEIDIIFGEKSNFLN